MSELASSQNSQMYYNYSHAAMHYSLAVTGNANHAFILDFFGYCMRDNKTGDNKENVTLPNGKCCANLAYSVIKKQVYWLSIRQIEIAINSMVRKGILVVEANDYKNDHFKKYTFNDAVYDKLVDNYDQLRKGKYSPLILCSSNDAGGSNGSVRGVPKNDAGGSNGSVSILTSCINIGKKETTTTCIEQPSYNALGMNNTSSSSFYDAIEQESNIIHYKASWTPDLESEIDAVLNMPSVNLVAACKTTSPRIEETTQIASTPVKTNTMHIKPESITRAYTEPKPSGISVYSDKKSQVSPRLSKDISADAFKIPSALVSFGFVPRMLSQLLTEDKIPLDTITTSMVGFVDLIGTKKWDGIKDHKSYFYKALSKGGTFDPRPKDVIITKQKEEDFLDGVKLNFTGLPNRGKKNIKPWRLET